MSLWCNGNIVDFRSTAAGSIPAGDINKGVYSSQV